MGKPLRYQFPVVDLKPEHMPPRNFMACFMIVATAVTLLAKVGGSNATMLSTRCRAALSSAGGSIMAGRATVSGR